MNISRIFLAAFIVAVFHYVVAALTGGGVFYWVYQLEPTNVWRPFMEDFPVLLRASTILLTDLIFVFVYALINKAIPGGNRFVKGAVYGLIVWGVGVLPEMFHTYIFMTVSTTVVVYWTIWGLVVIPLKGIIAAGIYGENLNKDKQLT